MWWEVPNHLEARNGELFIAGTPAKDIANKFGTPLYVYNSGRVAENYDRFHDAVKRFSDRETRIHYAMKANSNSEILKLLCKKGAWIDAVSPEEMDAAIDAGFTADKILFTGTSVSNQDLKRLADAGVRINIDSLSELKRLNNISTDVEISLRIDPGTTGAGGNWKVVTAGKESHGVPIKFSIPAEQIVDAARMAKSWGLRVVGIHEHIGSNWRTNEEVNEFLNTVDTVLEKAKQVNELHELEFVNFGGGPGVRYEESNPEFPLERYAKETCQKVKDSGIGFKAICFEPGRFIVADAGLLLAEVVDVKERYGDVIAGVNSGFNHLVRPVMYGSYHEIINCSKAGAKADTAVTVSGNLCETGDIFAARRMMPKPEEGDILAIHNAGAYGFSMASHYNMRALPKEIVL